VDGTLGGGGHTEAITQEIQKKREIQEIRKIRETQNSTPNIAETSGMVIAMDRDIAAINRTEKRLHKIFDKENEDKEKKQSEYLPDTFNINTFNTAETFNKSDKKFPIRFAHANYCHFDEVLDLLQIEKIDGFLLDLGLSSDQLLDGERGFSFDSTGLLDLRFDTTEGETARELLERLTEEEIADIIYQFGEERYSRRIARAIVERRKARQSIQTAHELAELVRSCVPRERRTNTKSHSANLDPATRTFQALRIAVNDELGALKNVLKIVPNRLKQNGVMVVLSFHSLEDRMVKNAFRDDPCWEIITKKPVIPSEEEIKRNPRARSAKLRAARKR
ncbi:MAG: 16S rRNA (cytosine(1402)-N(4))-methyltransferase RsmH, partial [Planctomycetaceae bacterium]|jgi:16S rRNA (cytosine1402-N4)-methyltransferase|nr:16S rRNA (cytosine(1402)-N(4))-methyltransferase RsmH [Planctomycetaceae bacterium]